MESVRPVEPGFSPLDEHLALAAGGLSPRSHDHLIHLATWMPFERATQMLAEVTGVQVSEATTRRRTYCVGSAAVEVQTAQACALSSGAQGTPRPDKQILSVDGAMVPLVHGQWAEVKTAVVADVEAEPGGEGVRCTHLSYFSRMQDASTFCEQASAELLRRGVERAKQVGVVADGAEWIDGFVDWQRPDALRILDFAHAAEYVSRIGRLAQEAGTVLSDEWLRQQLHTLKHEGPRPMLVEMKRLCGVYREGEELGKQLAYLEKREARMQYPQYQAEGWPIGSGIVESGNKVVMQARLKGAGMHWAPEHVNPMLALRTTVCNARWEETGQQVQLHLHRQKGQRRTQHLKQRYERTVHDVQTVVLFWQSRRPTPVPPAAAVPASPAGTSRPSPTHPWRRRVIAKK